MSKYDYGYDLLPNTTTYWAYEKIKEKSTVLELGPAIGNLAKHLKEDKHCVIDIIEIDTDAGEKAAKFARNSCVGEHDGNLEEDHWFEKLKMEIYDYIVILDVLEHLRNPQTLLKKVGRLLKKNGRILISMPNIAHNSVILELINNQFRYTKDGLLDDTHIRFFTYESFKKMLDACGMEPLLQEANNVAVGKNEIEVQYNIVPKYVEQFLRSRPMADVYQFLFVVQRKEDISEKQDMVLATSEETMYKFQVFTETGDELYSSYVLPGNIDESITLSVNNNERIIRIDPLEYRCISRIILLEEEKDGEWKVVPIFNTNGVEVGKNIYYFSKNDPNIFVKISAGVTKIHFKCQCIEVFDMELWDLIQVRGEELQQNISELLNKNMELLNNNAVICEKNNELNHDNLKKQDMIDRLKESEKDLNIRLQMTMNELNGIKSTRPYRIYIGIKKILKRQK